MPKIPTLTNIWHRLLDYVVDLRSGQKALDITSDTQKLDANLRRLMLQMAYMAVFGVSLAVPTARVPDDKMAQFIAQEDATRRPNFK